MNVIRVLAHRVQFLVQEQQPSGRFDTVSMGTIDYAGHIDEGGVFSCRNMLELGIAKEVQVSDLSHELFATEQFLLPLKPALLALPRGWQEWSQSPNLGTE